MNDILALLLLEHKDRDRINMSEYKKLASQVKSMLEMGKPTYENFTRDK